MRADDGGSLAASSAQGQGSSDREGELVAVEWMVEKARDVLVSPIDLICSREGELRA